MPTQFLLTVAYDGTNYAGWQFQKNGVAVQQILEEALSALLSRRVIIRAASRTDAGVHALGQRAAFFCDGLKIPADKLPAVINGYLPRDIAVTAAEVVPDDFNPRHALYKTYKYQFYNAPHPNPLLNRYSAFIPQTLDIDAMGRAALYFTGRHDFKAFQKAGDAPYKKPTVREIFGCHVTREGPLIALTVTGNGFLHNMVRIIAGTVLYAGLGKILPEDVPAVIASGERERAGKTMPPEGLTLVEARYAQEQNPNPRPRGSAPHPASF